ncbi:MAG: hypothetical protein ABIS47_05030 [Acidimicrobiales bacterium]
MSTVLLLVVLAGWIGVGFWWFVTHRGAPSDAIGSFARQLGTLERRNPGAVPAANRLTSVRTANAFGPQRAGSTSMLRAHMQKRRRDIFIGLALTTGGSLIIGILPPLRLLWLVTLVSGALLASYCYLLVQLRTLAVERDMQARFSGNHNRGPRVAPRPAYAMLPEAAPRPRKRRAQEDEQAYAYRADSPLLQRNAS